MTKPTKQELDRIIIGNQIALMKACSIIMKSMVGDISMMNKLDVRIHDVREFWHDAYDEEIGYPFGSDKEIV